MKPSSRIGVPAAISGLLLAGLLVVTASPSQAAGASAPVVAAPSGLMRGGALRAGPARTGAMQIRGGRHAPAPVANVGAGPGRHASGGPRGHHRRPAGAILTPGYLPVFTDGYAVPQEPVQQVVVQPVVTQTQIVNQPYYAYAPMRINCTRPRILEVGPARKSARRAPLPRVIYGTPDPCR